MRFLIVIAAVLGYASAGALFAANHGDLQAAAIDATVAAQDHARAVHEGQARHAEAVHLHTSEAVRQAAEVNRDVHENAYWNGVAATQDAVAAAQSHAAAASGVEAAARANLYAHGYAAPHAYGAPLAYAAPAYAAPLGYGGHLGYHGW